MVKGNLIKEGRFDEIRILTAEAVNLHPEFAVRNKER